MKTEISSKKKQEPKNEVKQAINALRFFDHRLRQELKSKNPADKSLSESSLKS